MTYSLIGLSGSLRREATNTRLLGEAARLFGAGDFTLGDLNLPLYDGDHEDTHGIPAQVQILADQIAASDGVIISTPEYNSAPSGVLKNALDWISRTKGNPWNDKPVAVMSAAAGRAGGARAQVMLRGFLVPFRPRILSGPELHLAASATAFDDNGQLTSAAYTKTLQALMDRLRSEVAR